MDRHCSENKKRLRDEEDIVESFQRMLNRARHLNLEEFNELLNKYMDKGLSRKAARKKANSKLGNQDYDAFIRLYKQLLAYTMDLQDSYIHNEIIDDIRELVDRGRTQKSAINRVVNNNEEFSELFENSDTSDSEDSESEDIESEGNTESNDEMHSSENTDNSYDTEDDIPLSQLKN